MSALRCIDDVASTPHTFVGVRFRHVMYQVPGGCPDDCRQQTSAARRTTCVLDLWRRHLRENFWLSCLDPRTPSWKNHLVWNILQTQDWSGPMTSGSVSQNRQDEVHRYVRSISFCGPGTGWEVSFGFDLLIIGEPSWACVNTFGWCVHGTYSLRYEYRVQPSRQFKSELTWWWQRKDLKSENEIEIR